ncbi:ABC transporter permease [Sphingomonas hylomeconis]|uniref:ABC transporter permease n=1 Tax=Sphingomonas hylomeconis TaxID=1395958 RepID=A0ABV7SWF4_9SPHN|nr:ABC transporter permease [Sphingomonas hylomeconis]
MTAPRPAVWNPPPIALRLGDTLAEGWRNLRAQGRRSALALLGIVIGTAAIIAMLNSGHMAQRAALKLFAKLGVDMLQIQAASTGAAPAQLSRAAIEALPRHDRAVLQAVPLAIGRSAVRAHGLTADLATLAAPPALGALARLPIAAGRALRAIDDCTLATVLGAGAARALSAPAGAIAPGDTVLIGQYGYTVIGVLAPVAIETLDPVDYNLAALLPPGCAARVIPGGGPNALLVRLRDGAQGDAVGQRLIARFAAPGLSLTLLDARTILRTMQQQRAIQSRMLTAIGAVSLLVGGIGVMNVMLMSVMERRREIGLRAAIGATPADIGLLFLVEAMLLSAAGGVIGAALGGGIAYAIARGAGWTFALAPWTLALGPGAAGTIGLVFGLYPAIGAAGLAPIEALRAD